MDSYRKVHILGFILWRGGLLLAGGYALYLGARYLLRLGRLFGIVPAPALEIGFALALGGFFFVVLSLILERIQDARKERGQKL